MYKFSYFSAYVEYLLYVCVVIYRSRGKHGSLQSRKKEAASTTETITPALDVKEPEGIPSNPATETIIPNNPVPNPCPFTSVISEDSKRQLALKEFDEKVRKAIPSVDKALITRSGYHQSLLRVSWNLIESEILHSPGKKRVSYSFLISLKLSSITYNLNL